jgi:hypothetical protein
VVGCDTLLMPAADTLALTRLRLTLEFTHTHHASSIITLHYTAELAARTDGGRNRVVLHWVEVWSSTVVTVAAEAI